ncbi:hypothetical protein [Humidisolicoccus flavus]|uniref:hypothetical protein n=1 Tax=Humidisolicoccus flavus TaxID=3111414 RepID=UPI003243ACF7
MHTHSWTKQSSHGTSEGLVTYLACACGARDIQLTAYVSTPFAFRYLSRVDIDIPQD